MRFQPIMRGDSNALCSTVAEPHSPLGVPWAKDLLFFFFSFFFQKIENNNNNSKNIDVYGKL
jgi:hypothetical protein